MKKLIIIFSTALAAFYAGQASACPYNRNINSDSKGGIAKAASAALHTKPVATAPVRSTSDKNKVVQ